MPALIISTNPDGSASIAALPEAPQELMADAQQFGSMEEALKAAGEVLEGESSSDTDPNGEAGEGPDGQPMDGGQPAMPGDDQGTEDNAQAGYDKVRRPTGMRLPGMRGG